MLLGQGGGWNLGNESLITRAQVSHQQDNRIWVVEATVQFKRVIFLSCY
jgi:hypothetical protein